MGLKAQVQVRKLDAVKGGMAAFYTPQTSDETMLVDIPAGTVDDLYVHHFQTDQLLVVRGSLVLVVLQNREYRYIGLCDRNPQVVTIPPGVPHAAINLGSERCVLVNAVLRHGPTHPREFRPLKRPFFFDLEKARQVLQIELAPITV
jgi:dTDP-4-dehydrorhamnose 3,5-epimerase-like enzyme